MFAQTTDIRRNVAALFFAVLLSTVTVLAAVGPAQIAAPAIATVA